MSIQGYMSFTSIAKNLAHLKKSSIVGAFKDIGGFNWVDPAHAMSAREYHLHEVYVEPKNTFPSTFFQAAENVVDFDIPQSCSEILDHSVVVDLANGDGSNAFSFGGTNHFAFSRVEVLEDGVVKGTFFPDIHGYIDDFAFAMDHELEHHEAETRVDATTRGLKSGATATIPASSSTTFYIHFNTFLNKCKIAPCTVPRHRLTIRCISAANWALTSSAVAITSITATNCRLIIRERRGAEKALMKQRVLDYSYLDANIERVSAALTSGSEYTYTSSRFKSSDIGSHFMVLIRANGSAGENLIKFLDLTSLTMTDENGNSLTDGRTYTNAELLNVQWPRRFRNAMTQQTDKRLYVPICHATDPSADVRRGTCTGSGTLPDKVIVKLVAAATATRELILVHRYHSHIRIENGELSIHR